MNAIDTQEATRGSHSGRQFALVWGILAAVGILPALMVAMAGFFLFDAPGSIDRSVVWALAYGLWAMPFACGATAVAGFMGWRRFTRGRLIAMLAVPLMWIAYVVALGLSL